MKHNSNVPAFLTKLWTLVEDSDTNELICWSQVREGKSAKCFKGSNLPVSCSIVSLPQFFVFI